MLKFFQAITSFLGMLLGLAIVGLLSAAGWFGYQNYFADRDARRHAEHRLAEREAQLASLSRDLESTQARVQSLGQELDTSRQEVVRLNADVEAKAREIERLEATMKLLTLDQRVARIEVLDQEGSAAEKNLRTRASFVEINDNGEPMEKPREFTIEGDVAYVDALVVKFSDEAIAEGDPLRSTSVALFRRIFGESQRPVDGFEIDPVGTQPTAYRRGGRPSEFEEQLWQRFWEYANDPAKAKQEGVRAAHGEAPFIKLMPGKRYRVELCASGGLSVVPDDATPSPPGAL